MATETDRKRFHLERIIENISEDSTLVRNGTLRPSSVTGCVPVQVKGNSTLKNSDSAALSEISEGTKSASDSTSEEDFVDEKDDSIDGDESAIPMKISPRCDICGLLHFKSYRCLTRFSAPSYLRQAFDKNVQKLRVCRKCLTSKESCVENVAISSLASYSAQIRQMKIPLGMTGERRTKAFDFVVRDLKQLKNGRRSSENGDAYLCDDYRKTSPVRSPIQPMRKTLLQRFNVDDPVEKNLFLKELNLYSTDVVKSMKENNDCALSNACGEDSGGLESSQCENFLNGTVASMTETGQDPDGPSKRVYHVAAKNVLSTNVTEKKIGEMFDARKGMSDDLVVNTKRAWKPNKKYDDLRKVERPPTKKESKHRGPKSGKSPQTKSKVMKVEKTDQPEKIRTCGINCAVCDKHVQKSYSCCTLQTAPEKFKHLFKPGVHRLKICRKCIPYKKVVKVENQVVKKNPGKIKQKRGRKPRSEKHGGATVKAIHSGTVGSQQGIVKSGLNDVLISTFTAKPFASVMDHKEKEMLNISEDTVNCDRNRIMSMKMESNHKNMNNIAQNRENVHFLQSQPEQSLKVNEIPVGVSIN